jgi:hypothetical protein
VNEDPQFGIGKPLHFRPDAVRVNVRLCIYTTKIQKQKQAEKNSVHAELVC